MSDPVYKTRSSVESRIYTDPPRFLETEPAVSEPDDVEDEPDYGHRWEEMPDGTLREIPLTYADLLDPQVGDFIAEDTVHGTVIGNVAGILDRRYEDEPTVAVWRDLKVNFRIPGLTSGPGPDVFVVWGVRDRARRRRSFNPREESGKIRFVMEVVSKKSVKKDYKDILKIYHRMGIEEYIAIRPKGLYLQGPYELRGWRRNPKTNRLRRIQPDSEGRLSSQTTGLLFGTGADDWGLEIWDAATGKLLRPPDEEAAWLEERLEHAEELLEQAEERATRESEARQKAERLNREMRAELERLRAREGR